MSIIQLLIISLFYLFFCEYVFVVIGFFFLGMLKKSNEIKKKLKSVLCYIKGPLTIIFVRKENMEDPHEDHTSDFRLMEFKNYSYDLR